MADPREKLSATQVRDAGLEDWRQILGRLKARFRTGDFPTGLALVNTIGAAAEAANHHPDIQLTYSSVVVTLVSHDVGGITSRDLELARQISIHAAELGIHSARAEDAPVLDARAIPHAIRHAAIFGALDSLTSGGALVLVAPHDPQPLLAQARDRYPEGIAVEYLQSGPEAWHIRLQRA